MAWATPPTAVAGQPIPASDTNTISGDLTFLHGPPVCSVWQTATQTALNSSDTIAAFDAEFYDTDTMHSTSVNNSRVTCKTAGKYLILASAEWITQTGGRRSLRILLNGSEINKVEQATCPNGEAAQHLGTGRALAVNDYVEVRLFQDSGVDLDFAAGLQVLWQSA